MNAQDEHVCRFKENIIKKFNDKLGNAPPHTLSLNLSQSIIFEYYCSRSLHKIVFSDNEYTMVASIKFVYI